MNLRPSDTPFGLTPPRPGDPLDPEARARSLRLRAQPRPEPDAPAGEPRFPPPKKAAPDPDER